MRFVILSGRRPGQPTVESPKFTGGRLLHTATRPSQVADLTLTTQDQQNATQVQKCIAVFTIKYPIAVYI